MEVAEIFLALSQHNFQYFSYGCYVKMWHDDDNVGSYVMRHLLSAKEKNIMLFYHALTIVLSIDECTRFPNSCFPFCLSSVFIDRKL